MSLRYSLAAAVLLFASDPASAVVRVERISVNAQGEQGNAISEAPSVADGGNLVTFTSGAFNLVPGDVDDGMDFGYAMLRERQANTTNWVVPPAVRSRAILYPVLSRDGRHLVFVTGQTNLVPGDTSQPDYFRKDLATGAIERVNQIAAGGNSVGSNDRRAAVSADGRLIAFSTLASDLLPGDTNGFTDVYLRDMTGSGFERISVATDGTPAQDGNSDAPAISGDGRYVVFWSAASQLGQPTSLQANVFVRDRLEGSTRRVSIGLGGAEPNGHSGIANLAPAISDDGRWVLFGSAASNLVAGDSNGRDDYFLADLEQGGITRNSTGLDGGQLAMGALTAAMSADGNRIVYGIRTSLADDPFVLYQRDGGVRLPLNGDASGTIRGSLLQAVMSADGEFAAGRGTDALLGDAGNGVEDAVLFDLRAAMRVFGSGFE